MLRIQTLVDKLGKEYEPMINQIKIAEFTKTIAQLSNISIDRLSDDVIEEYLTHWATNKFRFFKAFGNKTRVDIPFSYVDETKDTFAEMRALIPDFPAYAPWLYEMSSFKTNKIDADKWKWNDPILNYLDEIIIDQTVKRALSDMAITTFFKRTLKAPDELVTKIGRIYENEAIDATFTISIDPVDMMMASENPYKWTSCYRLELMSDSHADGCLAAVLDTTSLITYVWNNKGKYSLYNTYDMKEIRYYRMREWISISDNFATIHFNAIYPGKCNYSKDLEKNYRNVVETYIAKQIFPNKENIWAKTTDAYAEREYSYGYGEFSENYMWTLKGEPSQHIHAYNVGITCPCGCGTTMYGTDDGGDLEYNGDGYICENFGENHYCEYIDDYCNSEDCEDCPAWRRENAVCELDENESCSDTYEAEDEGCFDADRSRVVSCGEHCETCPFYKLHHPEEEENEEEESNESGEVADPAQDNSQTIITTVNTNDSLRWAWDGAATLTTNNAWISLNDNIAATTYGYPTVSSFDVTGFEDSMEELRKLSAENNSNRYAAMSIDTYETLKNNFRVTNNENDATNSTYNSIYGMSIQINNSIPNNVIYCYEIMESTSLGFTSTVRIKTLEL